MFKFSRKIFWQVPLTPSGLENATWHRRISDQQLHLIQNDLTGNPANFTGSVLTSPPGDAHYIDFGFSTSPTHRNELCLTLAITSDSKVIVTLNGQEMLRKEVRGKIDNVLQAYQFKCDITDVTKGIYNSHLQVRVFCHGGAGEAIIFEQGDQSQIQSSVKPVHSMRYTSLACSFFLMSWILVLAGCITVAAHLPFITNAVRDFAIVGTALFWMLSAFRVLDRLRISVPNALRRIHAKCSERYSTCLPILALLLIGMGIWVGDIVHAIWTRRAYQAAIVQATINYRLVRPPDRFTVLEDAVSKSPWRIEAQALLSRYVWDTRYGRSEDFRLTADQVCNSPIIQQAARQSKPSRYLDTANPLNQGVLDDPRIWLALTIPEASGSHVDKIKEAIKLLKEVESPLSYSKKSKSPRAEMVILMLELELAYYQKQASNTTEADEALEKTASELERFTRESRHKVLSFHEYQEAIDKLAQYHLAKGSYDRAIDLFEQVINTRVSNPPLFPWKRPPEKLMIYHLFGQAGESKNFGFESGGGGKAAKKLLTDNEQFKEKFMAKILLNDNYIALRSQTNWRINTIYNETWWKNRQDVLLDESLNIGWRY